jgi:hypothetical protein
MTVNTAEQSIADLRKALALLESEQESVLREQARPAIENIVRNAEFKPGKSEDSTWVGITHSGVTMTIDGVEVQVTFSIKDVNASKALKAKVDARKKEEKAKTEQAALLEQLAALEAAARGTQDEESDDAPTESVNVD